MLKIAGITIPSHAQYDNESKYLPGLTGACWLQDSVTNPSGHIKYAAGTLVGSAPPEREYGVRPALILDNAMPVGSNFMFAGVQWTVCSSISNVSFAICDGIIATRRFDDKNNIWEKSELKMWLEEWLEYAVLGLDDVIYRKEI